jgi:hypothetical protein
MLSDGKSAQAPTTTRQLSARQWAQIRECLGLPEHARDDFELIVAQHFKGTAARERQRPDWNSEESKAAAAHYADGLAQRDIVMARNRGIKTMWPRDALGCDGWTYAGPITARDIQTIVFGRTSLERAFVFKVATCVEHHTGELQNHGRKWLPKMIAAIRVIDPEIGPGAIQNALRSPRHGVPPAS